MLQNAIENNTNEVFTKKAVKNIFAVMLILFLVGTFFDHQINTLLANPGSYWAAILQNGGAVPNVIIAVLASEILFQKGKRMEKGLFKYLALAFAIIFPICRFWSYFIEILGQFGQSIMNAREGIAIGLQNDYKFVVNNDIKGISFVLLYIIAYYVFHRIIQKLWLDRKTDVEVNRLMIVGVAGFFADTATSNIVNMIKDYLSRPRPFVVFAGDADYVSWFNINGMLGSGDYTSFPSGHTRCFFMSFYFPLFVNVNNISLKKKWFYFAVIYSFMGAISRILMTKHYLTDVMAGGAIALIGIIAVVKLFKLENEMPLDYKQGKLEEKYD